MVLLQSPIRKLAGVKTKSELNSSYTYVKGRVFKIASTSASNVVNLSQYKFSTHTFPQTFLNHANQALIESALPRGKRYIVNCHWIPSYEKKFKTVSSLYTFIHW